ncbi:hypothetical protein M0812_04482 [Anaeramoeba flamelloides]|nr:hypothetical protein M0812_04482 [Anaeramoeba flamelloides]
MNYFPADIKKNIIQNVLEVYLQTKELDIIFSSKFHLKWFFEFTGQAFALPIENFSITEKAFLIYDQWISKERTPHAFLKKNKFYCLREMINHLSLIFQPREGLSRDLTKKHLKLCKNAIQIYRKIGNNKPINIKTRKHLLTVLMGITDSLLQGEGLTIQPQLTQSQSWDVLKLLFELWLVTGTHDPQLWDLFKSLAIRWFHRKETVIIWSATVFGLMNRVIGILYGEHEGTKTVTITL